ncbi:MAG TPA: hypothetical protein VI548_08170 [Chitinophagaceae bacterium]|nr:hypothetical protein [Chitinophagaceae bacterium]
MKKLKLLLLVLGVSLAANSQNNQINIVNFTVKNTLPGTVDSWLSTPGALVLTAQKLPGTQVREPMMVLQIRSGSAILCGNTTATPKRVDPFEVRVFNTADLVGMLGNCRELKAGTYTICVQFFNNDRVAISREVCREFIVESPRVDYSPPQNIAPADKKQFTEKEISLPVTFRWTPLVPKPKEPVTYRLRVWQLMQGQNGMQAMKANQPFITKDVDNLTQTTIPNLTSGPCKPPYLCDFIWNVEASISHAGAAPQVIGTSNPTSFFVTQYIIQLDSIKVLCTSTPGVYSFSYTISNVNPGTANLTNFAITSSVPAGAIFAAFAPPLGTSISSGNQLTITGTINAATNLSNICIGAEITDAANTFWKASKDTCVKVESCRCEACDEKNFVMNAPRPAEINWNNNTLSFNQPINITTTPAKTIKSIKAELVYYEMKPQIDDCLPCDKDASLYGHFTNGANSQQWTGSQTNLSINITTPNVPCCSTLFKWCIRYKIEFADCTVCSKVICYEKKKEGCVIIDNNNNPK